LTGKQDDLAAVACALGWSNPFVELKDDALLFNELEEAGAVVTNLPGDPCGFGQIGSLRLANVEDKDAAKSDDKGLWLLVGILDLLAGLTFVADEGSQNRDTTCRLFRISSLGNVLT
jgi:hypothetical protein